VIVVVFLISAVAGIVLGAIGAAISGGFAMHLLVSLIASTLTAPIGALAASTIYFGLLRINEAPATEPPPPPAAEAPPPPGGGEPAV